MVSILVVMEFGLKGWLRKSLYRLLFFVSILVVMEFGLKVIGMNTLFCKLASFNPCCYGIHANDFKTEFHNNKD